MEFIQMSDNVLITEDLMFVLHIAIDIAYILIWKPNKYRQGFRSQLGISV